MNKLGAALTRNQEITQSLEEDDRSSEPIIRVYAFHTAMAFVTIKFGGIFVADNKFVMIFFA